MLQTEVNFDSNLTNPAYTAATTSTLDIKGYQQTGSGAQQNNYNASFSNTNGIITQEVDIEATNSLLNPAQPWNTQGYYLDYIKFQKIE